MSRQEYSIAQAAKLSQCSTHTLRYYEKIKLLPRIPKNVAGQRRYQTKHIELLHFIKRAQSMQFSLNEIKQLIKLDHHTIAKPGVQTLVKSKLQKIDETLLNLQLLKSDLSQLLNACEISTTEEKCPILEGIKHKKS